MVKRIFSRTLGRIRRLLADKSGTVSIDFVVSIPILLAVLVLTSEYGRVLQARSALENAVADATRYLARVPLVQPGETTFDPAIVAIAENLIRSRINSEYIVISAPQIDNDGPFRTVALAAAVSVATPALQVLGVGSPNIRIDGKLPKDVDALIVAATDTARHFGR
jgi:Flp pilus assembly protein TadG